MAERSPLTGQALWVNHAPSQTDPAPLLQRLDACKASGVVLKYHDGTSTTDNTGWPLQATFRALAPALKRAGYKVWAFGYWYKDDTAAAISGLVRQAATDGADGYCADVESPFEFAGSDAAIAPILAAIRSSCPALPLAYTTFPYADMHPQIPWKALDTLDIAMPQVYYAMLGAPTVDFAYNKCFLSMQAAGVAGPKAHARWQPIGQTDGMATAAQAQRFAALCENGAVPGISWWVLQGQPVAMDAVLAADPYAAAVVPPKA